MRDYVNGEWGRLGAELQRLEDEAVAKARAEGVAEGRELAARAGAVMATFNLDGPHTPEKTAQAAEQIAQLVRYLTDATEHGRADTTLPLPQDAARVLGDLCLTFERLPQLLNQIAGRLQRYDHLGSDDGDPAGSRTWAVVSTALAVPHIDQAGTELRRARIAADRLYLDEG